MSKEELEVYRANQISKRFSIGLSTVWKYAKDGKITPIHVTPRVTVFNADEVHNLFGIGSQSQDTGGRYEQ